MVVLAIRWVGVGTDRYAEMRSFALDVLGLALESEGRRISSRPRPWSSASSSTTSLPRARSSGPAPGVELLGDLHVMEDGYAWQHFRAPDGLTYELTFDPSAL